MIDALLSTNPFFVLNVSTRDTRDRIVEATETASLLADDAAAQDARSVLTNPRKRLAAEMAWLPGVAPSRARTVAESITPGSTTHLDLQGIVRGNVLADLMYKEAPSDPERMSDLLRSLFEVDLEIDTAALLRTINEDRQVARFPPVTDEATIETLYADTRKRWIRAAMAMIDRTPAPVFAAGLYGLFDAVPHTALTDEFIDAYQLEIAWFLDEEAGRASTLCDKAVALAPKAPHALSPLFDALDELLENWKLATRPIQVNLAARGLVEEKSQRLAQRIRNCAITLFNGHALLDYANRLNAMIDQYFAEIPEVAAMASEDAEVLADLSSKRAEQQAADARFAAEMRYSAEIGTIFKKRIDVDADKITYEGICIHFSEVKAVRWGAMSRSVNGIPTGTDYLIAIRGSANNLVIELRNGTIFENLLTRLWRTAATTVLIDFLNQLVLSNRLMVGAAVVADTTVTFTYSKGWGRHDRVELSWSDCKVWSENGTFVIGHRSNKKMRVALSYRDDENTHVLEHMIRTTFKKGSSRLSDFLTREAA